MNEFFPRVLGNEKTKERIGRAILDSTLPHAFLIVGPRGSGKSTLAREISAALNCERRGEYSTLPCGKCNCCKRIYDGNFPDVKILSKPKDKATLGVELIKDFREDMFLSSTESDHKIYIIDDGECMTADAQNALLKVFEEPPSQVVIFILATEGDKILTTIKSRAQHVAMSRFTTPKLEEHLLNISPDARDLKRESSEKFRGILMSADGVLGEALRLCGKKLAEGYADEHREICDIVRAFAARDSYKNILTALSLLPTKRSELLISLEKIISALRDLIIIKESAKTPLSFFLSSDEALGCSGQASVKELVEIYGEVQKTHTLCSRNANIPNLISSLGAKINLM